eukprot:COSAG01_NODE_1894_length_8959_cov_3.852603_15_plen_57_part_00
MCTHEKQQAQTGTRAGGGGSSSSLTWAATDDIPRLARFWVGAMACPAAAMCGGAVR